MTEKSLEITLTLKAGEVTLHQLQEQLLQSPSGQAALAAHLEEWLKAQVAGDLKVELQAGSLTPPKAGLGLNATEWLESQKFSRRPAGQPAPDYSATLD